LKGKAVEVRNLHYDYVVSKNNVINALNGVNLQIDEGDFIAIIGQNGSGKTTLVKHFNGLLKPTGGDVYVFGENTRDKSIAELSRMVGYVFQNPDQQIFAETVRKEVEFGPKNLNLKQEMVDLSVDNALKLVGLDDYEDVSPFSLSKGQKQGLAVASIIAMGSEIIILDEPTTGRDYLQSKKIMDLIKQLNHDGTTVIFITHNMQLVAEYSEKVVVMSKGGIILEGTSGEIFIKKDLLYSNYLKPPQITELSLDLWNGCHVSCNVSEFVNQYLLSINEK